MIARDITDKHQNDKEKQRMQRELQQSRKMESLGHLTGGIAHDFNNLLQVISGFTDLSLTICETKGETKLIEYLTHTMDATERSAKLVSQMLSFGRPSQVDSVPLDLAFVLREEIKLIRTTLPSTIEIEVQLEDKLPAVLMNPTQLQQMIMNLCVNARDAMEGQGKLGIRLGWVKNLDTVSPVSHKPIKGDWIEISISDTGIGINPDIIEDIFTPFYSTKAVGQGTGLGLSVVYGIMDNHAGHILVDTEVGKGSRLRLLLAPTNDSAAITDNKDLNASDYSKGHGENILIVDDEESITNLLETILRSNGYQPTAVTDSEKALALFKTDPNYFDLIISDQTMPKLTGIELISKIHELRPNLPAVLCSGFSEKVNEKTAENLNIQFFNKPVNNKRLIKTIALMLSVSYNAELVKV